MHLNPCQARIIAGLSRQQMAALIGCDIERVDRWERGEAEFPPEARVMLQDLRAAKRLRQQLQPKSFTFIDLFAGIGGMRLGFEAAGGQCVFTSEWNKYAQQTYQANFGPEPIDGDITQINAADIPAHDILVGGFPCQPFSIAGVSKKNALGRPHGFEDETQGTLFFDVERILKHHKPRAFLLENVKNLVSHDKGKTFAVIKSHLEALGYHLFPKILDAKTVLPQHRERIFIVGFRAKDKVPFSWDGLDLGDSAGTHTLAEILHPEDGSEEADEKFTFGPKGKVHSKYTLTEHLWTYLQNYAKKHQAKGNGFGCSVVGPENISRTISARYYKDGSEILIRQKGGIPRRLTPRECARLMGFDQVKGEPFVIPVSDTQAYKQFGNSVAVPLVKAVANLMAVHLASAGESSREINKRTRRTTVYA